jgi:hypothetical protein
MKKKFVLGLTSLVVASAVAIGGTLAFMTTQTNTLKNNFKAVGTGISGEIKEPGWNGYNFGDTIPDELTANPKIKDSTVKPDGIRDRTKAETDALGIKKAEAMTPGMTIPKDPTLKNTSKVSAFMAIKVTYNRVTGYDNDGKAIVTPDRTAFNAIATLAKNAGWKIAVKDDYDAANSSIDKDSDIYFFYGNDAAAENNTKPAEVAADGVTSALFNNVVINGHGFDVQQLKDNQFQIKAVGAAVQTTDLGTDDAAITKTAKTELIQALNK